MNKEKIKIIVSILVIIIQINYLILYMNNVPDYHLIITSILIMAIILQIINVYKKNYK